MQVLSLQNIFSLIGGLGLFLYGMKVMSEGLQLVAGDNMRAILRKMTDNRLAGIFTGFSITSLVQSSSATTVMVISLVNAGLMSLQQSLGVIFGANVGTTMTAWIVTLFGFKIKISSFALPSIGLGFLVKVGVKGRRRYWGDVVMGFGLLFLGLFFLKQAVPDAGTSPEMQNWIGACSATNLSGSLVALAVGTMVTAIVQSSSATSAVVLIMADSGLIDFRTAMIVLLGANIGTTVTALIASIGTNIHARRAAVAHFLFNILGSIWVFILIKQFERFIDFIWPGSPYSDRASLLFHLSTFHTVFNLINALLFLPFIVPFANLVARLVPSGREKEGQHQHLRYIHNRLLATPALSLSAARQEIQRMIRLIDEMFDMTMRLFENGKPDSKSVESKVKEREQIVDVLEREITRFLSQVSKSPVSGSMAREIAGLITASSDLERIGDHCEALLKLIMRKRDSHLKFTDNARQEILDISREVRSFLSLIEEHMAPKTDENIMKRAGEIEDEINRKRWEMRNEHIRRLKEGKLEVTAALIYLDMTTSFEKIGDHAYNVAEVISGMR